MKTIEESTEYFKRFKDHETTVDIPAAGTRIGWDEDKITPVLTVERTEYTNIVPEAFAQYLELSAGPGSRAVWAYASGSPKDVIASQMDRAVEMIQTRVNRARKSIRMHAVDEELWGVTSTRHEKVYDLDMLKTMENIVGAGNFHGAGFSSNVSWFEFRCDRFIGPDDLEYVFTVRGRNNQWGRHSLLIEPVVERVICSNGAVIPIAGTRHTARHVGSIDLGMMVGVIDSVRTGYDGLKSAIMKSGSSIIHPEEALEKIGTRYRIPKKDMERVAVFLSGEKLSNTLYGLGNAVARLANEYTGEKHLELQAVSGKIYAGLY